MKNVLPFVGIFSCYKSTMYARPTAEMSLFCVRVFVLEKRMKTRDKLHNLTIVCELH